MTSTIAPLPNSLIVNHTISYAPPIVAAPLFISAFSAYNEADPATYEFVSSKKSQYYKGIFDTGADHTTISTKVAKEIGSCMIDKPWIFTGGGRQQQELHRINVMIKTPTSDILFRDIHSYVMEMDERGDFLIGMDIIKQGDLHITTWHGFTVFRFATYTPTYEPPTVLFSMPMTPVSS